MHDSLIKAAYEASRKEGKPISKEIAEFICEDYFALLKEKTDFVEKAGKQMRAESTAEDNASHNFVNARDALESVLALLCHSGSCEACWIRPDCEDRERLLYRAQRCVEKAVPAQTFWSYSANLDGLTFDKKLQIKTQNKRSGRK